MDLLDRAFEQPEGWLGKLGGWWMAHRNRDTIAWTIGLLDVQPGHHVLEVGFGPGVGVEELLEQQPRAEVCGVDPSTPMLELARERNAEAVASGSADLRAGIVEELPWPDDTFDRAFSVNTYPWADPMTGLEELRRVLREQGRLAIGFRPREPERSEGLTDDLVRTGFQRPRRISGDPGVCVIADL